MIIFFLVGDLKSLALIERKHLRLLASLFHIINKMIQVNDVVLPGLQHREAVRALKEVKPK